ncbi:MAG: GntR family transcriptional regulator [Novosphingobium sp.]|nr:GntR family transcriptional regulator [Novosphingobium sp.]
MDIPPRVVQLRSCTVALACDVCVLQFGQSVANAEQQAKLIGLLNMQTAETAQGANSRGRKLRVKKASQLIADELKADIINGILKVGDSLPSEAVLTERYGVSRPTFREAIRILEAEDLVRTTRGGRGGAKIQAPSTERAAFYAGLVLQTNDATVRDVLHTRAAIVPLAAKLAAEQPRTCDFSTLRLCLDRIDASQKDSRMLFRQQQAFEAEIFELSRSKTMQMISRILEIVIECHFDELPKGRHELPEFILDEIPIARRRSHELMEAIVEGHPDEAFRIAQDRATAQIVNWDRRIAHNQRLSIIAPNLD